MPSKLTVHLSSYPDHVFEILEKMQLGFIKVFNYASEQNIDAIKRVCPNVVIAYRQYTNLDYHSSTADMFFAELQDAFRKLRGRGLLWEGLNEPVVHTIEEAKMVNRWYVRFAEIMHANGELAAAFSWSTGNPVNINLVAPYVADAAAACDVHAYHEYYNTMHGGNDWARYRQFEAALPAHARKPVIITEAGLDNNGEQYTGGYRGRLTYQQYLDVLKQYDALLMQDPYVLGATIFAWGDWSWPSFELQPMIDLFANHILSVGQGAVTPRPWPIPQFGPPPSTYFFAATPERILQGQSSTLKWDVEGVQAVYLDGEAVTGHGTKQVSPTDTTSYTLHVLLTPIGANTQDNFKDLVTTVTVIPQTEPTYSFSATPSSILQGESSTLQWEVDGVQAVYLDGQGVVGHSTRVVSPAQTTTYTFHIVFLDGTSKDLSATITVIPQTTYSFSVTPQTIVSGQSAMLKWDVEGVKAVSIEGQGVLGHGTRIVTPDTTATYTLHIILLDDSTQDLTATVVVQAPPPPPALDWDPRLDPLKVTVTQASALPAWRLVSAKYLDANESGDKQDVKVQALREDGSLAAGVKFVVDWVGRDPADDPAQVTTDANGQARVPLWVAFDPQTQTGINFVRVVNQSSDTVNGLGLPNNQKVSFVLTFKWKADTTPPPASYSFTATPATIVAGQSATLTWSVSGASAVALDGAAVAMSGTQNVTPAQTKTYTLHLVLNNGTTKDLTVTVNVNAPGSLDWDSRLDDLGITLTRTSASPGWKLVTAKYQDVTESAGKQNVFFKALRADGSPASNVRFVVDWQGRDPGDAPAIITTDASGLADCPLWAGFDLSKKNGIYFATSKDQPGDTVGGLGLPNNQLVSFALTFQWGSGTPPTYTFSATPTAITAGQFSTLQWSVTGASTVSLDGQSVAFSGTQTVTPSQTKTYTLHLVLNDGSTKDLTVTVTVTPGPPQPTYSFSANPQIITTGQSAVLTWNVTGATSVSLDGLGVAMSGMQSVSPTQTTTYTLHILFNDSTTKDLGATVTVAEQLPPGPTRPPTVVITPENIAHLKTFPRPADDNGRGLHFNIDLRDYSIGRTISHLQAISAKWTMVYARDELQAARVAKACWAAGIMPVIRVGKKVDEPYDAVPYVTQLKALGVPPYVQLYNEPGDDREWRTWPGAENWVGIFAERWAGKAADVVDAGGYPGLQILGREEFDAVVNAVQANGRTDIWQRAFYSLHNYGANHPPSYPYDELNQRDHPGATILDDDISVLSFLNFATWMKERIGFVLPIMGGEGGWEFGADEDRRYPKLEQPYHGQFHKEMFDEFRTGILVNGEPLPDYLFSIAPWIEGGWGADDWWGGPLGDKTETVRAVQAIPPFVRKFSWDGGTPPPPESPYPPLTWDGRLDTLGVNLQRADSSPAWRVVSALFEDDVESGGNHNIYFKALNADGTPAANVTFVVDFIGRNPSEPAPVATTDENGEANSPIWGTMHAELKDGVYFTSVQNEASDTARGMGLPANRHVNFILTFQKV